MKKIQLVICGNYGATNLGDEAILSSFLHFIKQAWPSASITVMSARPQATADTYHCQSVYFMPAGFTSLWRGVMKGELKKTLKAIRNCDFFILGGGGLFNDDHPRAIIIWFLQALAAMRLKKPLLCLGQSVGPLKKFWTRFLVKKVFQAAKLITMRDDDSQRLLETLNIKNVKVFTDVVFGLTPSKNLTFSKEKVLPGYVVFSVRPWHQLGDRFLNFRNIQTLAKFSDYLFEHHELRTLLIPFQQQHDDDSAVLAQIQLYSNHKEAIQLQPYSSKVDEVLHLISGAQAVIGMRLHSIIFATLSSTPFLALSYSQKVKAMVQMLGSPEYVLNWAELNLPQLTTHFEKLLKDQTQIRQSLIEKKALLQKKAQEHMELLKTFIEQQR